MACATAIIMVLVGAVQVVIPRTDVPATIPRMADMAAVCVPDMAVAALKVTCVPVEVPMCAPDTATNVRAVTVVCMPDRVAVVRAPDLKAHP